ncbi:MAG: T9SS type A sorting domain-containing protein [Bacteroidales bacterium]|jgi:hypothetical protein|nr:T9SS type A sorting domain-containing protein [Bacteroidales bacterium]
MRKKNYTIFATLFIALSAFNVNIALNNRQYSTNSRISMTPLDHEKLIIKYTYDNAGNRIKRELVLVPVIMRSSLIEDNKKDAAVEETDLADAFPEMEVKLYPNPSQGIFWVEISGADIPAGAQIEIFSNTGALIKKMTGISPTQTIDISKQPRGIYFMRIIFNKDYMNVWKIIKN